MTEQEMAGIIRRAAEGDSEAFRMVVTQNQTFLYSVTYRFLGNVQDAEDAVQEVFVRLWKNLPKYTGEIKLTTWLYRIAVNLCLDVLKSSHHRQQRTQVDITDYAILRSDRSTDDDVQTQELHRLVQEAASELTPKQKAVFILRDLEGLPVEEVCSILSMRAGNVKSNLYCARQQMSGKLKKYYQTTHKIILQ